jgi:hypothetical protein
MTIAECVRQALADSNVPMYLIGAPHRHKADAQRLLEKLIS